MAAFPYKHPKKKKVKKERDERGMNLVAMTIFRILTEPGIKSATRSQVFYATF